ncbi:MAG TPA: OmpA family protein [Puia sp.]|nr:OmpA family protein [Puia sp.]
MKPKLSLGMIPLMLIVLVSCGTSKKLKMAEDHITRLQSDSITAANNLSSCNSRVADLNNQITSLNSKNASLNKEAEDCRQLKQDLQARVDRLNAALAEQGTSLKEIREKIISGLSDLVDSGMNVTFKNGLLYIELPEKLLFKKGSAVPAEKYKAALSPLASILNNYPRVQIYVVGHTDTVKIHNAKFEDNWALSTERANSIVRVLRDSYGIDPHRLLSAGRSKYSPIASNDTEEGKAQNRRIELILNPDLSKLWEMMGD